MSRVAVLSDIHGNLPALEAVVADSAARGCDAVLNLGDCVSGPLWPAETATFLMARDWPTIAGNHERQLLADRATMGASDAFAAERLSSAHRDWIAALPTGLTVGDMWMCHGTPASDVEHLTVTVTPDGLRPATDDELLMRIAGTSEAIVLCGHTHIPALRSIGQQQIANPGSVGLQAFTDDRPYPYSVEAGSPAARYAMVEDGVATLLEVAYDHHAAAAKARREGFDGWARWLETGRV
ncbi:metallophosphatase family protein [Sphingomonas donggukensis]|uniref:Metallophosphatase family protein n=1 Tax=Sphingomonas donggukensis TaxID=2949093 RepID=A0ABY4TYJ6_9SPHN|nr:metallophosphoesterase family protein [Sphingomonas donggukensis]URW76726.1 metallophosphatase family protein [Sphingomonas donggukensis]